MTENQPTIEEQIDFLKDCYLVAASVYTRATSPIAEARSQKALRHLQATIKLLEGLLDSKEYQRSVGEPE